MSIFRREEQRSRDGDSRSQEQPRAKGRHQPLPGPPSFLLVSRGAPGRPSGTKDELPRTSLEDWAGLSQAGHGFFPRNTVCLLSWNTHPSDRKDVLTLDCERDLWVMERSEINRKS